MIVESLTLIFTRVEEPVWTDNPPKVFKSVSSGFQRHSWIGKGCRSWSKDLRGTHPI